MKFLTSSGRVLGCIAGLIFLVAGGFGQEKSLPPEPPMGEPATDLINDLGNFGNLGGFDAGPQHLTLSGTLKVREDGREGVLEIQAALETGWHVYALTQEGGPGPSSITVKSTDKIEVLGPFQPDHAPERRDVEVFDVPLLEHYDKVTWTAPIRLAEGIDPKTVELDVRFDGTVCHDESGCVPAMDTPVPVRFGGTIDSSASAAKEGAGEQSVAATPAPGEYRADRSHVTIRGHVEPASVRPGEPLKLVLTAVCEDDWHIYAYAAKDPDEIAKPTLIVVTEPPGWTVGVPQVSKEPTVKEVEGEAPVSYHDGTVSWTFEIQVPADAVTGPVQLAGMIGYQTCTEVSCDRPLAAEFQAEVSVASGQGSGQIPLAFAEASYGGVAKAASSSQPSAEEPETAAAPAGTPKAEKPQIDFWAVTFQKLGFQHAENGWTHAWLPGMVLNAFALKVTAVLMALVVSFLGGMILNVMPCVLPVIGLKLMSFVHQAGEDRWRIFSLNVWYSLGMWLVFLIFAIVAAVLHLLGETFAWGEHLGDPRFSIPLLLLVFALGLSMFGVWEIPIPGFVGSGKANELAEKEGPPGAFFKGVLTTVLATPCSGPFIGVAVGIAVIAPIWLNFSMFTAMALGMAIPYLLIGAFPGLIKWLPKPGEWMNTFKEFMGFILMGTAVWILYFLETRFVIPVLSLLVGVAAACWIIGGTSIVATSAKRLRNWGWGLLFALTGVLLFLTLLEPPSDDIAVARTVSESSPELPWEAYTADTLEHYLKQGRTVMVDFTADW